MNAIAILKNEFMMVFRDNRIGHVFKVKRRPQAPVKYKDYYCTILKNDFRHHLECKYVTYIPNLFTRPLTNYLDLKSRVEYVGTFEEFGHLLFNQDPESQLSNNTNNEFNTKLTIKNYADTIHTITPKI